MVFNVFRRPDGVLVIVPALFQPPIALEREGQLRALGEADVPLSVLTDALVEQLGVSEYAVADGVDAALLRTAAARPDMAPPASRNETLV